MGLSEELFPSGWGHAVIAGATIVLRRSPEGSDPAPVFEPVERGVEGTVLDLKNIFRTALDGVRDSVTVRGACGEST
jgi:hypothetical protein